MHTKDPQIKKERFSLSWYFSLEGAQACTQARKTRDPRLKYCCFRQEKFFFRNINNNSINVKGKPGKMNSSINLFLLTVRNV